MRKEIIRIFKDNGLTITIDMNLTIANFLDCTFDMAKGTFYPYKKDNNSLLYINNESNHPPNIRKQLPKMIEKRLSDLSCNEREFNKARDEYENALRENGFNHKLSFLPPTVPKRTRSRNIVWFNPPYNAAVTTNIGKRFLTLIDRHFPPNSKYSKIFNRNDVKISYSCTRNIGSIITNHNKHLTSNQEHEASRPCNCTKYACPVDGQCRSSAIIYKAKVETTEASKYREYIGMAETEFKTRFYNHESSFRNFQHRTKTTLSQYIWQLKEEGEPFEVKWSLIAKSRPYRCGTRRCDLCLSEKYEVITNKSNKTLNKRTEIANSCRHRAKFKLKNIR